MVLIAALGRHCATVLHKVDDLNEATKLQHAPNQPPENVLTHEEDATERLQNL